MDGKHILVVDDEASIRTLLSRLLERNGFIALPAEDAQQARLAIADQLPDLVLLDWMLPGTSGDEFARELRSEEPTRELPIIMLTARGGEGDRVQGLDLGCDDYVAKPFSSRELLARIRAVLRRSHPAGENECLHYAGLEMNLASERVKSRGEYLRLGPKEFLLLKFFMTHPERVYTREQLLNRVWGRNADVGERTVDVHIRRLRKVLSRHDHDALIQTVRGSGYRFSPTG